MTREFTNGYPQRLPACYFLSQYYFYNIFLQKSCRFSLQTLAKFEAAKTGSGVGFLRLTAVWSCARTQRSALGMTRTQSAPSGVQCTSQHRCYASVIYSAATVVVESFFAAKCCFVFLTNKNVPMWISHILQVVFFASSARIMDRPITLCATIKEIVTTLFFKF